MKEYIEIVSVIVNGRKTPVYKAFKKGTSIYLGDIVFNPQWRKWVWRWQPEDIIMTLGCLNEAFNKVANFEEGRKQFVKGFCKAMDKKLGRDWDVP